MNPEEVKIVFHPEQNNYLGVGSDGTQPGEIPVTVEDDPVKASLQVPRLPFHDATVAIGLRLRNGQPGISGSGRQADSDSGGGFAICAVNHLRNYSHNTRLYLNWSALRGVSNCQQLCTHDRAGAPSRLRAIPVRPHRWIRALIASHLPLSVSLPWPIRRRRRPALAYTRLKATYHA